MTETSNETETGLRVRKTHDGTGWVVVDSAGRQVSPPAPKFWPNRRRATAEKNALAGQVRS